MKVHGFMTCLNLLTAQLWLSSSEQPQLKWIQFNAFVILSVSEKSVDKLNELVLAAVTCIVLIGFIDVMQFCQ